MESNYKAERIRSNMPSVQLRLAKIYAIDQFRLGVTALKSTGFEGDEIENLLKEFLTNSFHGDRD